LKAVTHYSSVLESCREETCIEGVPCFMQRCCTAVIDKDMMVLQNHTNPKMKVQDPCVETDPTSRDASQAINIKVEEASDAEEEEVGPVPDESQALSIKVEKVSDAEEEEDPVPITFPKIKIEPEVRSVSIVKSKGRVGL
jgi:hypothetical protein